MTETTIRQHAPRRASLLRPNVLAYIMSSDPSVQELETETIGYRDAIRTSIRQRTGDDSLAEDVAQETLLRVIDRLRGSGLQDPARLKNFVYRVAANVLAETRRKGARDFSNSDYVEAVESTSDDQLTCRSRTEESRLLWQSLQAIGNDGYRDVLIRFYLRQESKQHICETLGLTPREFTQRLSRARKSLRKLLDETEHLHGLRLVE